ncbi:MAG: M12 family metallo-peptidase [Methylomicrobium sp.]
MNKFVGTSVGLLALGVSGVIIYDRYLNDVAEINQTLEEAPSSAGGGPPPDLFDSDGIVQTAHKNLPAKAVAGRNRTVNVHAEFLDLDRLTLNLFDDVVVTAVRDRLIDNVQGSTTWIGHVEGEPDSEVFLTVRGATMSGNVQIGARTYEIEPKGHHLHDITQVDPAKNPNHSTSLRPEGSPPPSVGDTASASTSDAPTAAASSTGTVIDLLVAYTPKAKTTAGGQAGIESKITNAVAMANQAYINSQIDMQLNLVAMVETDYVETGNMLTTLTDLKGTSDGKMDDIHNLRDQYGADQVSLVSADSNYCGYGYIMTSGWRTTAYAPYAFSVVHDDSVYACLTGNTLAHELGHNQGNQHNIEDSSASGSFDYSYGYRLCQTGGFRTIMSYSCSGGTRISYFSNPDVMLTSGIATGASNANNALSMTNNKDIVAAFRSAVVTRVPDKPSDLTAAASSSSQIALEWTDNSSNETGFRLERSADGVNWSEFAVTGSNAASFTDTGLVAGTDYQYRVRAYNSAGFSAYSNVGVATTPADPCVSNTASLSMTQVGMQFFKPGALINLAITLTNKDSSTCGASLFILTTGDGTALGSYSMSPATSVSTAWNFNAPDADGTYTKSVSAKAANHADATASTPLTVDGTAPTAPGGLTLSVVKKTSVSLKWTTSSDSGSGFDRYDILRNGSKIGSTQLTSYTDNPGGKGGTFTYSIRAFDKAGNASESSKTIVK